jgi:hypothetical protein
MGADGLQYLPTHVRVTLGMLDENAARSPTRARRAST